MKHGACGLYQGAKRETVIPGRAVRREPGIHLFLPPPSGFRVRVLRTRPGMTGQDQCSLVFKHSIALNSNLLTIFP
jgi:hypothetical protein